MIGGFEDALELRCGGAVKLRGCRAKLEVRWRRDSAFLRCCVGGGEGSAWGEGFEKGELVTPLRGSGCGAFSFRAPLLITTTYF